MLNYVLHRIYAIYPLPSEIHPSHFCTEITITFSRNWISDSDFHGLFAAKEINFLSFNFSLYQKRFSVFKVFCVRIKGFAYN